MNGDGQEKIVSDPGGKLGDTSKLKTQNWKNRNGEKVTVTEERQKAAFGLYDVREM